MTEYKLFAQRVGLLGITTAIVSLRGLILMANPNFNEDIGCRCLWHLISNNGYHLAIIASGTLGLTSAMIRFLAAEKDKKE